MDHPDFVATKLAIARVGAAVAIPINFLEPARRAELCAAPSPTRCCWSVHRWIRGLGTTTGSWTSWRPAGAEGAGGTRFRAPEGHGAGPRRARHRRAGVSPRLATFGADAPAALLPRHPGPRRTVRHHLHLGTTGSPRRDDDARHDGANRLQQRLGLEDGRRILFPLPMYHVYGYVEGLLAALFVGGAIVPQLPGRGRDAGRHRAPRGDRRAADPDHDAGAVR